MPGLPDDLAQPGDVFSLDGNTYVVLADGSRSLISVSVEPVTPTEMTGIMTGMNVVHDEVTPENLAAFMLGDVGEDDVDEDDVDEDVMPREVIAEWTSEDRGESLQEFFGRTNRDALTYVGLDAPGAIGTGQMTEGFGGTGPAAGLSVGEMTNQRGGVRVSLERTIRALERLAAGIRCGEVNLTSIDISSTIRPDEWVTQRMVVEFDLGGVISARETPAADDGPVEETFLINPWRQTRTGDACVTASQVRRAFQMGTDHELAWLEIETHDGRTIQSELQRNQEDLPFLMGRMQQAGVHFRVVDFSSRESLDLYRTRRTA